MPKTQRTDPDPSGQTCGYQLAYGMPWNEYCAETKARGKYFCTAHDRVVLHEDGIVHPHGTAKGR